MQYQYVFLYYVISRVNITLNKLVVIRFYNCSFLAPVAVISHLSSTHYPPYSLISWFRSDNFCCAIFDNEGDKNQPSIWEYETTISLHLQVMEHPRGDWRPLVRQVGETHYHVIKLRPELDYSFRIRAENEYGMSDPTDEVFIRKRAGESSLEHGVQSCVCSLIV